MVRATLSYAATAKVADQESTHTLDIEDAMRKKTHRQQLSADDLLKTKTGDIELTEKELGQVTGGDKSAPFVSDQSLVTKGTTKGIEVDLQA
jgi:hypothetical protein